MARHAVTVRSVGPEGEYYTTYGHVDPATALLPGAKVAIGQAIGTVGTPHPSDSELTTGAHVHIQMATLKRIKELKLSINEGTQGGVGLITGRDKDAFQDPERLQVGLTVHPTISWLMDVSLNLDPISATG